MSVTYSFTNNDAAGSTEFETIAQALSAATDDARQKQIDNAYAISPVSVDDHEGNFYDAATINRQASPRPFSPRNPES